LNFEQLLFLEIFELLHKFGSNLDFKSNGNFVNKMNSTSGQLSPPAIFFLLPGAIVAVFGIALAWRRLRRGFLLLPGCPL